MLGSAGWVDSYENFSGAPVANTWYRVALANNLANNDLNGGQPEIRANFSSTFGWYLGTDGQHGTKLDFVSVVLQELGHGLGFAGSMIVTGGQGSWGYGSNSPYIYDWFAEDGNGISRFGNTGKGF